jgi:hypothetical protein
MSTTKREKKHDAQEPNSHHRSVDFTSILRIRPLSKSKEKEDHVVLEKSQTQHKKVAVAVLHPSILHLTSPEANKTSGSAPSNSPNFIKDGQETEFHFHKILDTTASQESVFFAIGLSMASDAMEPLKKNDVKAKSAVVVAMGNAESGKTHTVFGKVSKSSGNDHEGLAPRVIETLFSQSRHHISSTLTFGVRVTLLLVEKTGAVRDLLVEQPQATSNRNGVRALVANFEKVDDKQEGESGGITIVQDPITNDFNVDGATSQISRSSTQAREILILGLQRSQTSRLASFGKPSSRGHVMITLQPVLMTLTHAVDKIGGTICMVDLSSKEKGKKASRSGQMKDSISGDSTFAALMHCFRTIIHNKNVAEGRTDTIVGLCDDDSSLDGSDISCVSEPKVGDHGPGFKTVPWRQSKVTMLLQPMFSSTTPVVLDKQRRLSRCKPEDDTTKVILILNAYPGHRDYTEKRSILNHMEILQGHALSRTIVRRAQTGLDLGRRKPAVIEEKSSEDIDTGLPCCQSEDDDDFNSCFEVSTPSKRQRRTSSEVVEPYVMLGDERADVGGGGFIPMPPPTAPSFQASLSVQPSAPPSASDFPGVALPTSSRDLSSRSNSEINQKDPPSREYIRAKLSKTDNSPAVTAVKTPVVRARAALSPLVQARVPSSHNILPPTSDNEKSSWMNSTPVKTMATAVNVGMKHGQRAFDKIEKLTRAPEMPPNHSITKQAIAHPSDKVEKKDDDSPSRLGLRLKVSHRPVESGSKEEASHNELRKQMKELEEQNARLVNRNIKLEARCELLEREKTELATQLREARRHGRQQEWTQLDEEAWKQSRRMRLAEQDLIQGPLQQHLNRVEETFQINCKWLDSGKQHFSLGYPKWWKGARELNERDRALQAENGLDTLHSPARLPHRVELSRKPSGEKRKDKLLKRTVNVEQCKRLKKY